MSLPAALMWGMDASQALRNFAVLLVFAVGFFSVCSKIASHCGVAASPNKIISSRQLNVEQNLSSWQLTPPWIPPKIEAEKVASGIRASAWCDADCRAKFVCKEEEVKICFWDQIAECKCRDQDLLPSEWHQEYDRRSSAKSQRGNSLAVVMGGQPRSFASSLMREYWRLLFLNLKQQMEVVLFAVLSRKSTNTKSKTEASIFTTEQLQHILAGIEVTWRAAFPLDCTWEEAALLVKDPALRFLLSPPEHLRRMDSSMHIGLLQLLSISCSSLKLRTTDVLRMFCLYDQT